MVTGRDETRLDAAAALLGDRGVVLRNDVSQLAEIDTLADRVGTDHGHRELARTASTSLLEHLADTYADHAPATIWEAYAPVAAAPATDKDGRSLVRPELCGWSALGPISMLIEHVLGFRVDATTQAVHWDPDGDGRQGIRRLSCGRTLVDAIADGNDIVVDTDHPITLVLHAREIELGAGRHHLLRDKTSPTPA